MRILKPRCNKLLGTGRLCGLPAGHKVSRCTYVDWPKRNAYRKARYATHPPSERVRAASRLVTAAWGRIPENRLRINAGRRALRKSNPEKYGAIRRAEQTASYATNPTPILLKNAAWVRRNPKVKNAIAAKRRAVKAGATTIPFTKAQYIARMASLGDVCYYGKSLGLDCSHECDDHFYPLQPRKGHKPGTHSLKNLVPSCRQHNSQKHNKQPMDFINKLLEQYV